MVKPKILFFYLFLISFLFADVHIHIGGEAYVGTNGAIQIRGSLFDDSASQLQRVKFSGTQDGMISGPATTTIAEMILELDSLHILTLNKDLQLTEHLILNSGSLTSNADRNEQVDENSFGNNVKTNSSEGSEVRTGNLNLQDSLLISLYDGNLDLVPAFGASLNLAYYNSRNTGSEIPAATNILSELRIINADITLGSDCTVTDSLIIADGSIATDIHQLLIRSTGVIAASPENITGNLSGELLSFGTSSYINPHHSFQLSAGNDMGNFYSLLFLNPIMIGTSESIEYLWRFESSDLPENRDLTLQWPASADNGVNNYQLQVWKSEDAGTSWDQIRETSSSITNPRSLTINDIQSFSDWTIAEPYCHTIPAEIVFGNVIVGSAQTLNFQLHNDRSSAIQGDITVPTNYSITDTLDRNRKNGNNQDFRNFLSFSVPAFALQEFQLTFSPPAAGLFEDTMDIDILATGDPGRKIVLKATGYLHPKIEIDPTMIQIEQPPDTITTTSLTISNIQGDDLIFASSVVYPDRQQAILMPQQSDYWTGTCTESEKTDVSEVRGYDAEDGWMKFDTSAIPDDATINSVEFHGYVNDTYYPYWSITPVNLDPVIASAADLHADIIAEQFSEYYLYRSENSSYTTGWKVHALGGSVNNDLQNSLSSDWFTIGIASRDNSTTWFLNFDGWRSTHIPFLVVNYTVSSTENWLTLNNATSIFDTLAAGENNVLEVGCDSNNLTNGSYTASIITTSNDPEEPFIETLVNLIVGNPDIFVSLENYDFGNVLVGADSTIQFQIENTGTDTLLGEISTPMGFSVLLASSRYLQRETIKVNKQRKEDLGRNTLLFSLTEGESQFYDLIFSPSEIGNYTGNVEITHNAPIPTEYIAVNGNGVLPDISIEPESISKTLPNFLVGTDTLTIQNTGDHELNFSANISYLVDSERSAAQVYPHNSDYWTGSVNESIKTENSLVKGYHQEDGWIKFDISAIPDNAVIDSIIFNGYVYDGYWPYWSITPVTNDPVTTDAVTLKADIVAEQAIGYYLHRNENSSFTNGWKSHRLEGNAVSDLTNSLADDWFAVGIASRDNSTFYYINFCGWLEANKPYLDVYYTLPENWLSLNGENAISGNISASSSEEISIEFDPTELEDATYEANIEINSNDPDEPFIAMPVFLTVSTPAIDVYPDSLNFAQVIVGTDSSKIFTIENTGNGTLSGTISTPDGFEVCLLADRKKFSERRNLLNFSINSNMNQFFEVTFSPDLEMIYSGNIEISHNASDPVQLISVSGEGIGLAVPSIMILFDGTNIIVSWSQVCGAISYKLYRSSDPYTSNWGEPILFTTENSYVENDLQDKYFYRVIASTEDISTRK